MPIDQTNAPLYIVRAHDEDHAAIEAELNEILARAQNFVMIVDHPDHDHDDETPEERRQKALMFKRIREPLRSYCLAMIVVEGDNPLPAALRFTAQTISKGLGFSVLFAADETQALRKGKELLASR